MYDCICTICLPDAQGSQKTLDTLKLELKKILRYSVEIQGTEPGSSLRMTNDLNC